ncbi:DNA mismatch repair protein MutS [Aureibacillus halotolerans]|uniref:DNA mismatch repair protein MutS n=1 Tax=Aureibacillus halotolerans TaxID=1508390 RepID=A0A4R6U4L3_9BACI|nr:DNA mismatch repair protein MutS [Aureibacillus halotolerans]TDQ39723.1 DNA mismatch repair protein MutS [Aureibacillus halotolerans]
MPQYTPMMQQYLSIKSAYKDAFLFFRLGDFYEMFFDDATRAAQILEIALTSRDGGGKERVPMCGVPHHAAKGYIKRFIDQGYKVAICEQVEDPKQAKGVVKREVTHVISPGMVMDETILSEKEHNFLAALAHDDEQYSLALCDLTTGTIHTTCVQDFERALEELKVARVKEVIVSAQMMDLMREQSWTVSVAQTIDNAAELPFAFENKACLPALLLLTQYLQITQQRSLDHLQQPRFYEPDEYLTIDSNGRRTLELVETMRDKTKKGSLLWLLDETKTAMGGRRLKEWLDKPLRSKQGIQDRLDAVSTLIEGFTSRHDIREKMTAVYDIERLAGRISYGNANARDLVQVKKTVSTLPGIQRAVSELGLPLASLLAEQVTALEELEKLLANSLLEEPPLTITEGDMIADGYSDVLDRYRDAGRNGKEWIAALEKRERDETQIRTLKVGFNRVFGYYIEVSRSNLKNLPEGRYERKQTLANAERFITDELKEKERLILEAQEKSVDLEHQLFLELRQRAQQFIPALQELSRLISELDVLASFAEVSERSGYVRPQFSPTGELSIVDGRHPVVEKMTMHQHYVANSVTLDNTTSMLLITGPNMSGKSTYMRQVALIAIMAQIGCFVPAKEATLPLFDQVFTRIGAADDLAAGQSTFMVEMMETNDAIQKATASSLLLLDEIGRGTSTYDGMALAQSILEYIHNHIGAKTLFSTHYHELTQLELTLDALQNVHVAAVEDQDTIVFLHKVEPGPSDRSYGIHVAKLAGLPDGITKQATALLQQLEQTKGQAAPTAEVGATQTVAEQLSLFGEANTASKAAKKTPAPSKAEATFASELASLDLMDMTPLEAMNWLYRMKKKVQ